MLLLSLLLFALALKAERVLLNTSSITESCTTCGGFDGKDENEVLFANEGKDDDDNVKGVIEVDGSKFFSLPRCKAISLSTTLFSV